MHTKNVQKGWNFPNPSIMSKKNEIKVVSGRQHNDIAIFVKSNILLDIKDEEYRFYIQNPLKNLWNTF